LHSSSIATRKIAVQLIHFPQQCKLEIVDKVSLASLCVHIILAAREKRERNSQEKEEDGAEESGEV